MNIKNILAILLLNSLQLFAIDPNNPYTDRRAPLSDAPHENPPMLIALSSDDNFDLKGMEWMIETLNSRRHADSSNLRMTFFCNTRWGNWKKDVNQLYASFKEAYNWGNEVTSHTATHIACVSTVNGEKIRLSDDSIYNDIEHSIIDLENIGIAREHMAGFRTPYVSITDSTFIAIKKMGFTYDASAVDGQVSLPGDFHWPFTIDTPNDTLLNEDGLELPPSWWDETLMGPTPEPIEVSYLPGNHLSFNYNNYTNRAPIRQHSGLWELPLNALYAPDSLINHVNEALGYISGGIAGISIEELIMGDTSDSETPVATGAEMSKEQALATLIHTFDETYAGNRSPMSIVFHTPNFSEGFNEYNYLYPYCNDPLDRQWIVEQFIDYALQKEEVWFVSGEQVINYCKNPVSVDNFHPDNFSDISITATTDIHQINSMATKSNCTIQLTSGNKLSLKINKSGFYTVKILSLNGRVLFSQKSSFSVGKHIIEIGDIEFNGIVVAQVKLGSHMNFKKIILQ